MTNLRRTAFIAVVAAFLLAPASALAAFSYTNLSWGTDDKGPFAANGFIGISATGDIYVADTGNNRISRFDQDGNFLNGWGQGAGTPAAITAPQAVAVSPANGGGNGNVYFTDRSSNQIHEFTPDGTEVTSWSQSGSAAGQTINPVAIAVDAAGRVYVADTGNRQIVRYFADGTFDDTFNQRTGSYADLRGIAVSFSTGTIYAVDGQVVDILDTNGNLQSTFGAGTLQDPHGIAATDAGVYVADRGANLVVKFGADGTALDSFGANTGDAAFASPFGVAMSTALSRVYVFQTSSPQRAAIYSETGSSNLSQPTTGETANVEPVQGTVRVKRPGSNEFELLAAGQQIPIGSIVDVTKGTVDLTTTASDTATQTARFYAGVFKLAQDKSANPVTELQLYGGNFKKACPKPRAKRSALAAAKKKVVRQLWGVGKGKFRTKGKYAAASIRGTQWLTQDRCDGTLVRVTQGSVQVRDFVKGINRVVNAGSRYLAATRPPKRTSR